MRATFAFTYEIFTEESVANGECEESGFATEPTPLRGHLREVIREARSYGCGEPNTSRGPIRWWSSVDDDVNYRTGESTRMAFHLDGVTTATANRIHRLLTR